MSSPWSLRASALAVAIQSVIAFGASAADQSTAQSDGIARLDQVQVTADRKAEDSKDVPVSATVLRPEYLDAIATSASDVRVLAGKAPSLNVESSNGRVFPRFYIRGYGNTDYTTLDRPAFCRHPQAIIHGYSRGVHEQQAIHG